MTAKVDRTAGDPAWAGRRHLVRLLRALVFALLLSNAAWPSDLRLSDSLTAVLLGPGHSRAPSLFQDGPGSDMPALCQGAEGHSLSCSRPTPLLRGGPNGTALLRPSVEPGLLVARIPSNRVLPGPVRYHLRSGGADNEDPDSFPGQVPLAQ